MINNSYTEQLNQLKNKNIHEEKIKEILEPVIKSGISIKNLQKNGQNLLLFACLYDNDNLFNFLAENYNSDFKENFKECIITNYTNKNPKILQTSFKYMEEQNEEQKEQLSQMFAQNCYRSENIEIVQNWIKNNLSHQQLENFISLLFKHNNKPFLIYISCNSFWKELIKNYTPTNNTDQLLFYRKLLQQPIENKEPKLIEESCKINIEVLPKTFNKIEPVVLKKKRKIINTFS